MIKLARLILIIILFCHSANGNAQDAVQSSDPKRIDWNTPSISATYHHGFLIPHRTEVKGLIKDHARGIALNAEWLSSGKKYWHHVYKRPFLGFDLWACDLGNPGQLGQQLSLIPYIRLPFNTAPRFRHDFKMGAGVGYTTKTWDLEDNTKALFIGAPFNAAITLEYALNWRIIQNLEVTAGLRITHFSNGAFKTPNMGTNTVTSFAGLRFVPKNNDRYKRCEEESPVKVEYKKWTAQLVGGIGMKEISTPNQGKFMAYVLNFTESFRVNNKVSLGLGADYFYTTSLLYQLELLDEQDIRPNDAMRLGVAGVSTFHFGRASFLIMAGGYVYDKRSLDGSIYSRFGIHFDFTDHITAGFRLKTHFAKADHSELVVGWKF